MPCRAAFWRWVRSLDSVQLAPMLTAAVTSQPAAEAEASMAAARWSVGNSVQFLYTHDARSSCTDPSPRITVRRTGLLLMLPLMQPPPAPQVLLSLHRALEPYRYAVPVLQGALHQHCAEAPVGGGAVQPRPWAEASGWYCPAGGPVSGAEKQVIVTRISQEYQPKI